MQGVNLRAVFFSSHFESFAVILYEIWDQWDYNILWIIYNANSLSVEEY